MFLILTCLLVGVGYWSAPAASGEKRIPVATSDEGKVPRGGYNVEPGKPGERVPPVGDTPIKCQRCGMLIPDFWDGQELIKAETIAERAKARYGEPLCIKCGKKAAK